MRWTRLQINALKETYTKNLGKIIKRYTLHFKNNAARARTRAVDSERQRDVPDEDRPREEESLETAQVGYRAPLGGVLPPLTPTTPCVHCELTLVLVPLSFESEKYVDFLTKFQAQMQLLKKNLEGES